MNISPAIEQEKMYLILPRHLKRPIGILMSSFIDVVDTQVDLDMASYQADGLLGTAIINDIMTLFIDIYRLVEMFDPGTAGHHAEEKVTSLTDEIDDNGTIRILLLEDISFFRQHRSKFNLQIAILNSRLDLSRRQIRLALIILLDLTQVSHYFQGFRNARSPVSDV